MMVLSRPKAEVKPAVPASVASTSSVLKLPAPPASQPATKPLTNAEISTLLPGTWKFNDAYGAFFLNLGKGGFFSTYRESVEPTRKCSRFHSQRDHSHEIPIDPKE
jgi:hypothetical protein